MDDQKDRKKGFCRSGGTRTYDKEGKLIEADGKPVAKTSTNKKTKPNLNEES